MSELYVPKFFSEIEFQNDVPLLLKGRLLNEFVLHFCYAAELSIQTQLENQDSLLIYQKLADESRLRLQELAKQYSFEAKLDEILKKEDHYKFVSYINPDVFESIFLKDLELKSSEFIQSFVSSLKGLRFASDLVTLHHREFIFHLCRLGQIHKLAKPENDDQYVFPFDVQLRDRNQVLESEILRLIQNPEKGSHYWSLIYENKPQQFLKIPVVPGKSEELAKRLLYLERNLDHELFLWDGNGYGNFSEFYWSILRGGLFNRDKKFRFVISKQQANYLIKMFFHSYFIKTDKSPNSNNLTALLNSEILEYSDGTPITPEKMRGNQSQPHKRDMVENYTKMAFTNDIKVISKY